MIKLWIILSMKSIVTTDLVSHSLPFCVKLCCAMLQQNIQQEFGRGLFFFFFHSADIAKCGGEGSVSRGGMNAFKPAENMMEPEWWSQLPLCSNSGSNVFFEGVIFLCLPFKAAVDFLPFYMNHCLHILWVCSRQLGNVWHVAENPPSCSSSLGLASDNCSAAKPFQTACVEGRVSQTALSREPSFL